MRSLHLAAVSVAVLLAACGTDYSAAPTAPSSAPDPTSGGPTSAIAILQGAESLGSRAFAPPDLTVDAGTTIAWTNDDSVAHTSTSDVPGWNSGILAPRATFALTLRTAGTFTYHCSIHPGMVGKVTVR
ncbi:MAG: plastocyanin/azurin family copper-binding protein [Vicinamibacterales bacterium]